MANVSSFTAERMQEIEDEVIVDAEIVGGELILTRHDGTTLNLGTVVGPPGGAPEFVTDLPITPSDAEEVYLLLDDARGIISHLRYREDSASAYKWESLGGSTIEVVQTAQTTPIPSAETLDANVPTLDILAGEYEVTMNARFDGISSGYQNIWRLKNTDGSTTLAELNSRNSPEWNESSRTTHFTVGVDTTIKSYVLNTSGGAAGRQADRRFQIKPVRLA